MNLWRMFVILAPLVVAGCTSSKPDADQKLKELDKKITRMETELADFKERIKFSDSDRGLRDQMTEEQALLKSRLERLRESAKVLNPASPPPVNSPF